MRAHATYTQILIAALISLLIHAILLMVILQPVKVRPPNKEGLVQVALHLSFSQSGVQSRLQLPEATSSKTRKSDRKPIRALQTVKPKPIVANDQISGRFYWRPPSAYQQSEVMNAMQLQQIAFQRRSQAAAVLDGLSSIASQLGPVITSKIICTQQDNDEINCVPEPKENERSLIVQFLNLAMQAHRLGLSENPLHMDFGATSGVSVMWR